MTQQDLTALRTLSGAAFKLLYILRHSDTSHRLSINSLTDLSGLSRSSVRRAIDELLQQGYIARAPHCPKCARLREAATCPACHCSAPPDYIYSVAHVESDETQPSVGRAESARPNSSELTISRPMPKTGTAYANSEPNSRYAAQSRSYAQNRHNPRHNNLETYSNSIESLKPADAAHEQKLDAWKQENARLANYSTRLLSDTRSLGYHIRVWSLARRNKCEDHIFRILNICQDQERRTGKFQGKAFSRLTQDLFASRGIIADTRASAADVSAVRSAIADAPFMTLGA